MRRRVRLTPHEKDPPSYLNITTVMRPSNPRHAALRVLTLVCAAALTALLTPRLALAQQEPDPDEPALPEPPPTAEELAEAERARELTEQELAELAKPSTPS